MRNIEEKQVVLAVDDEPTMRESIGNILKSEYKVRIATNGEQALSIANEVENQPDIILLDIQMKGMYGYEVCKKLKANENTKGIPVIFVTKFDDDGCEKRGLEIGAVDYITKPFSADIVKARIKTHLESKMLRENLEKIVEERTEELKVFIQNTIDILCKLVADRSKETGAHIRRVGEYSYLLAKKNGMDESEANSLRLAAYLHDLGKISVPDNILNKRGALSDEEYEKMRIHAQKGAETLKLTKQAIFEIAAIVAAQHHEKWNGSGYPRGLKGEEIHIYGRITALADAFDAMANDRCYKKKFSKEDIILEINSQAGKHFDPNLARIFENNIEEFYAILGRFTSD